MAIVDVLKLTYATLEQMNNMAAESGATESEGGGPMWGRFFDSIGHDDNESAISGSHFQDTSFRSVSQVLSPSADIHPNDSASVMDDDHSILEGITTRRHGGGTASVAGVGSMPVDDGTYTFKFRTPSGVTHRFQSRHDDVEHLREIVSIKLAKDSFFTEFRPVDGSDTIPDPNDFTISYTDADGDTVMITSDSDVTDAVKIARAAHSERAVLFIQGGKGWAEAGAAKSEAKAAESAAAAQAEVKEVEKAEAQTTPAANTPPAAALPAGDDIMGIPKELLLPASIGALSVVILGIFVMSRASGSRY